MEGEKPSELLDVFERWVRSKWLVLALKIPEECPHEWKLLLTHVHIAFVKGMTVTGYLAFLEIELIHIISMGEY